MELHEEESEIDVWTIKSKINEYKIDLNTLNDM